MPMRGGTAKSPLATATPYFEPDQGGCFNENSGQRCRMWNRCEERMSANEYAWVLCERPNVMDIRLMAAQDWKGMLDKRERRLIRFLVRGMNYQEIAEELDVTYQYVSQLYGDLRKKLGAATNPQLVAHYLGHAVGEGVELGVDPALTEVCPHCDGRFKSELGVAIHIGKKHPERDAA